MYIINNIYSQLWNELTFIRNRKAYVTACITWDINSNWMAGRECETGIILQMIISKVLYEWLQWHKCAGIEDTPLTDITWYIFEVLLTFSSFMIFLFIYNAMFYQYRIFAVLSSRMFLFYFSVYLLLFTVFDKTLLKEFFRYIS